LRIVGSFLNKQALENTNKNVVGEQLKLVAFFLAILYFFLTIAHFFLLPEAFKWGLFSLALLTTLVCLSIGLLTSKISAARHSLFMLFLMLLVSTNSILHLWLSKAPEQTTNIFVTIIASGIIFSNRRHWAVSIIFNWTAWLVVTLLAELALIQHFFFAMAMSTLLSWFAHLARQQLVQKQIILKHERDIAIQHERKAKAATEAKSLFLANMSHEIRTPMNGVIGMIELISSTQLDDRQKDFVGTAKRSAKSLMVVINDILDFSKIEAGELTIEQIPFDVDQLFRDFVHDQQFQANKKDLKLELLKHQCQYTKAIGDPLRISQVLNNLLSNAIKFTQSGTITIDYEVVAQNDHLSLNVGVTDTGIGVSETALPHLFDSFSQSDMSTTRHYGGTGLGLAISKQLCELMGGRITVQSRLDEGSVFRFSINLAFSSPSSELQETPFDGPSIKNLANLSVLLVEDNEINQEVMLAILQNLEVKVTIASDGLEAIQSLTASHIAKFDLVLMDCQMPNLDGYETTRQIRAGAAGSLFSSIPIIAITANTMNSEREKCLAVGMNDFLTKPIDTDALKLVLAKYQPNSVHDISN
jgi:signal transduction histidine kinase/CheY-like chemotaxis protein